MAKKKSTRKATTPKKSVVASKKTEKVTVRILEPVFAKYRVVAEVGHVKKVHPSQATEMVANGDAELVK